MAGAGAGARGGTVAGARWSGWHCKVKEREAVAETGRRGGREYIPRRRKGKGEICIISVMLKMRVA